MDLGPSSLTGDDDALVRAMLHDNAMAAFLTAPARLPGSVGADDLARVTSRVHLLFAAAEPTGDTELTEVMPRARVTTAIAHGSALCYRVTMTDDLAAAAREFLARSSLEGRVEPS